MVTEKNSTGKPADPDKLPRDLGDVVRLINNGNVGLEGPEDPRKQQVQWPLNPDDPRQAPTTINLVDREYSYRAPDTGKMAHGGVSAAQEGADGWLTLNMDARSAWSELFKSWQSEHRQELVVDPLNLAVNVFH